MNSNSLRSLIIIGGCEDKQDDMIILREVTRRVGKGKFVVCTVAAKEPLAVFEEYARIFRDLGLKHICHLNINSREDSRKELNCKILEGASGVFVSGSDQIVITSQMGDTPCTRLFQEIYEKGGVIAGTSAGASVMGRAMMIEGAGEKSQKVGASIRLAPGLGIITGIIIDRQFSSRGRVGRLVAAVARNPANIGVGIDEDTAIVVERDEGFHVIGRGAVFVFDGTGVTDESAEAASGGHAISISDVRLHVLSDGDSYNLTDRRPILSHKDDASMGLMNPTSDLPRSGAVRDRRQGHANHRNSHHQRAKHL